MNGRVRVEPAGRTLTVQDGESILEAAIRHGWEWPTVCEGDAECGACFVDVLEGFDQLPPPDDIEEFGMRSVPPWGTRGARHVRLACQLRPDIDLTVRKDGIRPV